ncbi:hypothetical protein TrST_g11516 [Triparma strigata]|uniref:SLC26A/SulP transporter domain-containing protein n=1 Tax=Triparma strigata TaxID=1606541 RepID=A0A9W6ZRU5_9STRA|nr:hypothetical protein TrST_g11516 [Triparma strigata]
MSAYISSILSGLLLSLTSLPQLISYSTSLSSPSPLSSLPQASLPLIAWTLLSTDPALLCGLTAVTSAMAGNDLGMDKFTGTTSEYNTLISSYTFLTSLTAFLLYLTPFPTLCSSLDTRILKGFKTGCSFHILLGCAPDGLFLTGKKAMSSTEGLPQFFGGANKTYRFLFNLTNFEIFHFETVAIFLATFFIVRNFSKLTFNIKLMPGINVLTPMILFTYYSYLNPGLSIIGKFTLPSGSPITLTPSILLTSHTTLLPLFNNSYLQLFLTSLLFSAVNYMSVLSILPALKPTSKPENNLLAQSVSSLVSALVGGPPIGASLSRTLTAKMFNVESVVTNITIALVYVLGLNVLLPLVEYTPRACLGGVLGSAVFNAVFKAKGLEGVGWVTAVGVGICSPNVGLGMGCVVWGIEFLGNYGKVEKKKKE